MSIIIIGFLLTGCEEKTASGSDSTKPTTVKTTDSKSELKEIYSKPRNYMAKYNLVTSSDGQSFKTQLTHYFVGQNVRQDMTQDDTEMRIYLIDSAMYSCFSAPSQGWTCYKFNQLNKTDEDKLRSEIDKYDVVYTGTRTIAGKVGQCYKMTYQEANFEACYTSDGVPLFFKSVSPSGTMEMTAIQVGTASSSDLTLPAPAQEMPNYENLIKQYQQN